MPCAAQRADQRDALLQLGRIEAGEPFVEQQQRRAAAPAHGRVPAASGRCRSARPAAVSRTARRGRRARAARRRAARPPAPQAPARPKARPASTFSRQVSEASTPHQLEGARHAQPRDAVRPAGRRWRGRRSAMLPASGAQRAGDQVEHRGLARAVGAQQADDLAAPPRARLSVIDGDQAAEAARQARDFEQRRAHAAASRPPPQQALDQADDARGIA